MRFFRIPSFTGIETHRDDADRGSLRVVEGCLPFGSGGLRSGPVWENAGSVQVQSPDEENQLLASDDGKGNSALFVTRLNEVHDMALSTAEHVEVSFFVSTYSVVDPLDLYRNARAVISPVGNRLFSFGDSDGEAVFIGKGPPTAQASVFPDETLYSYEWSRFPNCKFFVQGPKKTLFASGNPDKPLTVYISEPASKTSPYRDTPYSTSNTNQTPGSMSTVDILGSNASEITALSTRGDQVVVHTDKGCHLLYAPSSDQAETGYRVEQAPATNFSAAVNPQVVGGESGTMSFWLGHDGQIYKDESSSRGAEDKKSQADPDQASWKAKGLWEKELPIDLRNSFATYDPQSGMYWIYVLSPEYLDEISDNAPGLVINVEALPVAPGDISSFSADGVIPGTVSDLVVEISLPGEVTNLVAEQSLPGTVSLSVAPVSPGDISSITAETLLPGMVTMLEALGPPGTAQNLSADPIEPGQVLSLQADSAAPGNISVFTAESELPGIVPNLSTAPALPGDAGSVTAETPFPGTVPNFSADGALPGTVGSFTAETELPGIVLNLNAQTVAQQLPAPANLRILLPSYLFPPENSAQPNWDAVTNSTGYRLQVDAVDGGTLFSSPDYDLTPGTTVLNMDYLDSNQQYAFRVKAIGNGSSLLDSGWSTVEYYTTLDEIPGQVTTFQATASRPGTVINFASTTPVPGTVLGLSATAPRETNKFYWNWHNANSAFQDVNGDAFNLNNSLYYTVALYYNSHTTGWGGLSPSGGPFPNDSSILSSYNNGHAVHLFWAGQNSGNQNKPYSGGKSISTNKTVTAGTFYQFWHVLRPYGLNSQDEWDFNGDLSVSNGFQWLHQNLTITKNSSGYRADLMLGNIGQGAWQKDSSDPNRITGKYNQLSGTAGTLFVGTEPFSSGSSIRAGAYHADGTSFTIPYTY